ncbi:MAG TPA: FAD-dependent monooxygenase [Dehalococcoidia bacterium]|nr:FAD-dependent monooxygenase [Dehalococcoidia bacterium]
MTEHYQVVIVGGGPVGMGLAVELGQRDISTLVVERQMTLPSIPKGQSLTNRTLEHFYFWNCVDELRAARLMPPDYPIGGVTAYGNLMSPYWFGARGRGVSGRMVRGRNMSDYYFQLSERLPQYRTEAVLRNRVKELPSVTTLFGWNADRVKQDENGTEIAISPATEGSFYGWSADATQQTNRDAGATAAESRTITADYVVGCDGGRSLVRESLGIDRSGKNFEQRMVLAVLRSRELHEGLKRFPEGTTYRVLKPELKGYWQFFGRIDVGEGFFFHAPVPAGTKADNYDFQGLLESAAGFKFKAELDHVGFWDLRVMVAGTYRKGRLFIAGDAAHQHPPYGGQGLNNGLEDATNLGWKLAACLQGWGGDRLLDSYTDERRTVFEQIGEQMIAGGIERDRVWLEQHNPERDKAEFEEAWQELSARPFQRENFDPNYAGSEVVMGPPGARSGIFAEAAFTARAGFHLAPRMLSNGRNVYEELGRDYTLLALDSTPQEAAAIEQAARSLNMPLKLIHDTAADGREAYESKFVLVRPDQFVAWSADEAPQDASSVLKQVTGLA